MSTVLLGRSSHPSPSHLPPLVHMLEDLHMGLFFMMLVYIACVLAVIGHGKRNRRLWRRLELDLQQGGRRDQPTGSCRRGGGDDDIMCVWHLQSVVSTGSRD